MKQIMQDIQAIANRIQRLQTHKAQHKNDHKVKIKIMCLLSRKRGLIAYAKKKYKIDL